MGKLLFVIQCEENSKKITQESDIINALTKTMKNLNEPFTIIPPDLANPDLSKMQTPETTGDIQSFRDIPAFTSDGNYAVDYPMQNLVQWIQREQKESGLNLCPDFQRGHVWTEKQQQAYIEFLLRKGRTGRDLYFNCPSWNYPVESGAYDEYVCVDGLQRLTAITRFIENKLQVFGRFYNQFTDRPGMQQGFLRVHINDLKTKKDVLTWYLEMNAGGTPHTQKELQRIHHMLQELES